MTRRLARLADIAYRRRRRMVLGWIVAMIVITLLFGFIEMMIFLVILVVGYVYIWNRGALRWA